MKNLKTIREQKQMTREELAFRSGMSHSAIMKIEKGIRNAKVTTARKIAKVLDVSIEELTE